MVSPNRRGALVVTAAALVLTLTGAVGVMQTLGTPDASANACTSACRSAYNACRVRTKGSGACENAYRACLRRCSGG